jgi:hypothetical protein
MRDENLCNIFLELRFELNITTYNLKCAKVSIANLGSITLKAKLVKRKPCAGTRRRRVRK